MRRARGGRGYTNAGVIPSAKTGLDWDGTAPGRRQILWSTPPNMHPATYLLKIYQRQQVTSPSTERYYTTFFWGNNGLFEYGAGYDRSFYGFHPYPIPANTGDGKWEISVAATDYYDRDDVANSEPYAEVNRWYNQACIARLVSGTTYEYKFYIDLPLVDPYYTITKQINAAATTPPSPALMVGQAPDDGSGGSWGHYARWEEQNAIIRGWQVYEGVLTEAQILYLSALETDAEVLARCSSLGISNLWYLNMNWTVGDISDKSGNNHNPIWVGAERPTLHVDTYPNKRFYTTYFDLTQNPISEDSRWHNPQAASFTNVRTANGTAYGTQSGAIQYDDSYAYLDGFANDHEVEIEVYRGSPSETNHEIEIHLRMSDDPVTDIVKSYEILFGFSTGAFQIMRWDGTWASQDFYLPDITGNGSGTGLSGVTIQNGDILKARIVGQTITVWRNGTQIWTVTDPVEIGGHAVGQPGIGFYLSGNSAGAPEFAVSKYTARSL